LLDDPSRTFKRAAFSQFPRGKNVMGRSIRTDRYRYTEWQDQSGHPAARELYDHDVDPNENLNVVDRPENREVVAKLAAELRAGWQAAIPTR
jgi:arylsulfatase A-like enzyme